jgi:hypothetical protein
LKIHTKRVIEPSNRAGEHDRPPALILLDDSKTVLVRKFFDGLNIGRLRPELLGIFLMRQVTLGLVSIAIFLTLSCNASCWR